MLTPELWPQWAELLICGAKAAFGWPTVEFPPHARDKGAGITSAKNWSHPIMPVRHGTPTPRLAQEYDDVPVPWRTMKLGHGKSFLAIALAGFIAEVRGEALLVPFKDMITHGVVSVAVGQGTYSLLVDTGTSITWVGARAPYKPGPDSIDTGEVVAVSYDGGSFYGEEFYDSVKLDGTYAIASQGIAVASSSTGIDDLDGVLGLVSIASEEIAFCGVNPAKVQGQTHDMNFFPRTITSPASRSWGIDATFTYGSSGTSILPSTAGIIDHGTSLTLLASDSYSTFLRLTGAAIDEATGFAVLDSCDKLESIFFVIYDISFEIPVKQYRWPADHNTAIGGDVNKCYLAVGDLGTNSGQGLDFILGYNTLKHFVVALDSGRQMAVVLVGVVLGPSRMATSAMTVLRAEGHSNCWSRVPVQDGLEPQFIDVSQGFSTNLKALLGTSLFTQGASACV
ncbi:hypothetical protein V501_00118 [Pseudogymnoascus sp. VKM F-4519 (FW-2642)]|nr:hypothetical protein V501_00118 [Pseudogymnoascus sp. VKM F-4519 (FW-2642)]